MYTVLEETIEKIKHQYHIHNIKNHLDTLKEMLEIQCQKLFTKNVKPITTQEEYDQLLDTFRKLATTMEKIVTSGRDFDAIHQFAEAIRQLSHSRERCDAAREEMLVVEKKAITDLIANLSNIFAKKYQTKQFAENETAN